MGAESLGAADAAVVDGLQGGFPVCGRPFRRAAAGLGMSEGELIARVGHLLDDGVLTRFGPMFDAERMGGAVTLCAMAVPEPRFEEVAQAVNAQPEVAHNYRREHRLNMWFVLATESPEGITQAARRIEAETGIPVLLFPKEREFFVGFRVAA